jgi:tRNA (cytidine/uridine-2'-O-)-methyltransferase
MGFAIDEKKIRRAGLDYWQHLQLTLHDSFEAYLEARKPASITFLSTKAPRTLYETEFKKDGALIFGCESSGLPKGYYERYEEHLAILPMPGQHARSINLANAVAIAAYEAFRRFGA